MTRGSRSPEDVVRELSALLQADLDTISVHHAALDSLADDDLRQQVFRFKGDHEKHVADLRELVARMGGRPPGATDLKGLLRHGLTRLAGIVGDEGLLRALLHNERIAGEAYAKALSESLAPELLELLRHNRADEARHLVWLEEVLRRRAWSAAPVTP